MAEIIKSIFGSFQLRMKNNFHTYMEGKEGEKKKIKVCQNRKPKKLQNLNI